MKKMILLAFLAIMFQEAISAEAVISGRTNQLVGYKAYIKEIDYYNTYSEPAIVDSAAINESTGLFNFRLNIRQPGKYSLFIGNYNAVPDVYIWAGDSLYFDVKFDETVSYEVTGTGKSYLSNKLITDFLTQFKVTEELQEMYRQASSSDTVDLLVNFITGHRDKQLEYLKNYNKNVPEPAINDLKTNIEYDWASTIISRLQEEIKKQFQSGNIIWGHTKYSDKVMSYVKLNNQDAWKSFSYRNFIQSYIMMKFFDFYFAKVKEGVESSTIDSYKYLFKTAREQFGGVVSDIAVSGLFRDIFAEMKTREDYQYALSEFEQFKKDATVKKFIQGVQMIIDTQQPLLGGMPVPQLTLPDTTGKMVSLSDYKGKVIYIDFWGTWCGPCRKEIPFLKELHTKFENNDKVVFMSVALERGERDAWLNYVRSQGLKGVQLFVEKNNRSIGERFKIASVPTFMLVDKNGNLADINAKRPSDPGIEADIKKLLE